MQPATIPRCIGSSHVEAMRRSALCQARRARVMVRYWRTARSVSDDDGKPYDGSLVET